MEARPCRKCVDGQHPPTKRRPRPLTCSYCDGRGEVPILPFDPLRERLDANPRIARATLGLDREGMSVLRRAGVPWYRADALAISIGCHPAEVWPDEWAQIHSPEIWKVLHAHS